MHFFTRTAFRTPQATLRRNAYNAMTSRVNFFFQWESINDLTQFSCTINQAFQAAGKTEKILSEPGIHLIHLASKGRLRYARQIITKALQIAADSQLNHLPDDIVKQAIESFQI